MKKIIQEEEFGMPQGMLPVVAAGLSGRELGFRTTDADNRDDQEVIAINVSPDKEEHNAARTMENIIADYWK